MTRLRITAGVDAVAEASEGMRTYPQRNGEKAAIYLNTKLTPKRIIEAIRKAEKEAENDGDRIQKNH